MQSQFELSKLGDERMDRALAIVPAFNEAENILEVLKSLASIGIDVLVVDDGSRDQTNEVVEAMAGQNKRINCIKLPCNLGVGAAVQTGMRVAAIGAYDFAIQVDADGQHIASEIPNLLAECKRGFNVVIGSRYLSEAGYRIPLIRQAGSKLIRMAIRAFTGRRFLDVTSGFRCYDSKGIEMLARQYSPDYPEAESIVYLLRQGLAITEVPVRMRPRSIGVSTISLPKSILLVAKILISIAAMP